jgi:hypothetical protein
MAIRINQINRDIAEFSKRIGIGLGMATEKISHDLHTKIIKRTPVKLGRARGSWGVGIGAPHKGPPPPPNLTNYEVFDIKTVTINGTAPVYITSNLVYIEPLENGWSKKAPNGMVAISVAEVVAEIDGILASLDKGL